MKKLFFVTVLSLFLFTLFGCSFFAPESQEFSGHGITITLDDSFIESESVVAPFYLTSLNHIFMGLRESKSDAVSVGIHSLREYTELVLENSGHTDNDIFESEGDNTYLYSYYSATVDGDEFGYMLICMEGDSYYYLMNFGCYFDKLEGNKDKYIAWTDSIIVE